MRMTATSNVVRVAALSSCGRASTRAASCGGTDITGPLRPARGARQRRRSAKDQTLHGMHAKAKGQRPKGRKGARQRLAIGPNDVLFVFFDKH